MTLSTEITKQVGNISEFVNYHGSIALNYVQDWAGHTVQWIKHLPQEVCENTNTAGAVIVGVNLIAFIVLRKMVNSLDEWTERSYLRNRVVKHLILGAIMFAGGVGLNIALSHVTLFAFTNLQLAAIGIIFAVGRLLANRLGNDFAKQKAVTGLEQEVINIGTQLSKAQQELKQLQAENRRIQNENITLNIKMEQEKDKNEKENTQLIETSCMISSNVEKSQKVVKAQKEELEKEKIEIEEKKRQLENEKVKHAEMIKNRLIEIEKSQKKIKTQKELLEKEKIEIGEKKRQLENEKIKHAEMIEHSSLEIENSKKEIEEKKGLIKEVQRIAEEAQTTLTAMKIRMLGSEENLNKEEKTIQKQELSFDATLASPSISDNNSKTSKKSKKRNKGASLKSKKNRENFNRKNENEVVKTLVF